jgi:hypothetical protein
VADRLINVIDELGGVQSLPENQVDQALFERKISRVATPEDLAKYERAQKYGTPGQIALTAAEALAAGATIGLSPLLEKASGVNPADIAARAEENAATRGIFEGVGMIAPALITPELVGAKGLLGATGKVLSKTPVGLLESGARVAETGVGRLLGKGTVGRVAESATSGALWGAASEAGQEIGEHVLGDDPQFNAEALLASIGTGALLGGGITGATRLLGDTLAKGARKLGEKVTPDMLRQFSNERAFEALGEGQLQMRQIERAQKQFGTGYKGDIGKIAKEEGVFKGLVNNAEDIYERAVTAKRRLGKELENIYSKVDDSAIARHPVKSELAEELRVRVLIPLQQSGAQVDRDLADTLQKKYLDYFLAPGEQIQKGAEDTLSFSELWNKRKFLDKHINYDITGRPAGALDQSLMQARRVIEDYTENKAQDAAKAMGQDFLSHYKDTKLRYSAMSTAEKISAKRDLINQTQQSMGIEPLVTAAIIGGATSLATGDVSLGAAGAAIGGFAASRFQQQISTLIKKYGSSAMAVGLDDLSKKVGSINKVIDGAVNSLTSMTRKAVPISMVLGHGETLQSRYEVKSKQYDQMTPGSVAAAIENKLKIMGPVAPNTLTALTQTAQAAVAHIQQTKPQATQKDDDIFTGLDKTPKVSDREMAQWLRRVAAAENPLAAIRSAGSGGLTAESVDTIRAVYPSLYGKTSTKILEAYGKAKVRPPVDQTKTASLFLGSPVAGYHSKRFVANCQKIYKNKPSATSQKSFASVDKNIKSQYSGAQALEQRRG